MSDLVERLRTTGYPHVLPSLLMEAADEIERLCKICVDRKLISESLECELTARDSEVERLRAVLQRIANGHTPVKSQEVAKRALEQKP